MKNNAFGAARAFLLVALPLCAVAASAQTLHSSITSFDRNGNAITQQTSGDENRSSVTTFDQNGNPIIIYTSPPVSPNPDPNGIQRPQSIAGLIANQNIYGQSAPNPNPGAYTRFGYTNTTIYPPAPGYYPYPYPGYGYPPPVYPQQQFPYSVDLNQSNLPWVIPNSVTSIPLNQGYAYPPPVYPAPTYPYPYPGPTYGYPAPNYGYPATTYPYPYGYGGGSYSSNTANYGIRFGRGGFSASIGGSNTTSRSNTTTTITTR